MCRFLHIFIFCAISVTGLARAAGDSSSSSPHDQGATHALQQAMMHAYMAGKSEKGSKSKMHQYMAMMQMMQANATAMAGKKSRKDEEKSDSAKASPSPTPNSQLEIAKLEIPKTPEEKPLIDFSKPPTPPSSGPMPSPPLPPTTTAEVKDILSKIKPVAKTNSEKETPAVVTTPALQENKSEPSKIPNRIEQNNSLASSTNHDSLIPQRTLASLGSVNVSSPANGLAPSSNALVPAAGSTTTNAIANITEPAPGQTKKLIDSNNSLYGEGGDGNSSVRIRDNDDGLGSLFTDMMGMEVRNPNAEEQIFTPEKEENPGSNIFEYASYRYRHTDIKKKSPKRKS